jgi:hypothetical protein
MSEGKKFDSDYMAKPPLDMLPPQAILAVGRVLGYGAKKYDKGNYLLIEDPNRYVAAALRHLMLSQMHELDEESGMPHVWHAACSLLMAIEAEYNHGSNRLYDILNLKGEKK